MWISMMYNLCVGCGLNFRGRRQGSGQSSKKMVKMTREEARALIGVGPEATPEEIKSRYKKLALQWCDQAQDGPMRSDRT